MEGYGGEFGEEVGVGGGDAGGVVERGDGADGDWGGGGVGACVVLGNISLCCATPAWGLHTWTPRPIATCASMSPGLGAGSGVGPTGITASERSHAGGCGKPGAARASWICLSTAV